MTQLDIAMIGLRGLPATYGGVERHVEEIGSRLVQRGHQVTVYCRANYTPEGLDQHRGMRLVSQSAPSRSGFEALVHSAKAANRARASRHDVIHFHAMGPGLLTPIARLSRGSLIVQTIHGRDDARAKWSSATQGLLRIGAAMSARVPHEVVVVSEDLRDYYRTRYGRSTEYITNGTPSIPSPSTDDSRILAQFGLSPGAYILFVGRLVPEKDPELLIKAFQSVQGDARLALVGGSAGTDSYTEHLRVLAERDPRVVLCGYQYGDALHALLANALMFVQPSILEGLPITLLEAIAHQRPVIVSGIPPHMEVVRASRHGARVFRVGDEQDLAASISESLTDPEGLGVAAKALHDDVIRRYDWDRAVDQLEATYLRGLNKRRNLGPKAR